MEHVCQCVVNYNKMLHIGKTAQNAISIMSYLAECYQDGDVLISSQVIADVREFSKPLVAKILTSLAQQGCVKGATGPGGGYSLSRAPREISLYDIVSPFERQIKNVICPLGETYCAGDGERCPLHDEIVKLNSETELFLTTNNLGGFSKY